MPRRPALAILVAALAGCVQKPPPPITAAPSPLAVQQAALLPPVGTGPHPAPAGWWHEIAPPHDEVFVGTTDGAAIWVDKHYRLTTANTRIAFTHWEFPAPQDPGGYVSERYVDEIDCDSGRSRLLERYSYAARLAAGRVVQTEVSPQSWTYMHPGSAIEGIARLVCPVSAPPPRRHRAPPPRKPPPDLPDATGEYL